MMPKKIFILLGHNRIDSLSGRFADIYIKGALQSKHEVRRLNLEELDFDPVLHNSYRSIQELEPDLKKVQEYLAWCDHFVLLYPNWWHTMPAKVKGVFDRAFLPGFAFNFKEGKVIQKLQGKTARVIIEIGTMSPFKALMKYGDCKNEIARGILGFVGFSPVKIKMFGPKTKENKDDWFEQIKCFGEKGI